jgi:hypothetical protein
MSIAPIAMRILVTRLCGITPVPLETSLAEPASLLPAHLYALKYAAMEFELCQKHVMMQTLILVTGVQMSVTLNAVTTA